MPGMTDKESWRRAWGPALRVFGYISAIYAAMFIIILVPVYLLTLVGLPYEFYSIAGMIFTIGALFAIPLSFFKVQDEMQPGEIPLQMSK